MRVTAESLAVSVAGRQLYSDLSFEWTGPCLTAVIGPSGSGKSTLLSVVMGWTQPSEGSIRVEPAGSDTWLVPQNAPLLDARSVYENLTVATLASHGREATRRGPRTGSSVARVLETFGLEHLAATRAKHLSGGERQRVALARAALRRPAVLLADEVTAGLDPASVDTVSEALRQLVIAGTLVVVATHDSRVWSAADDVVDLGAARR